MTETQNLYERCAPQKTGYGAVDTPETLATGTDARAKLNLAETLGDWALRRGHEYDRVFAEWERGNLWPQKRLRDGRLSCNYIERLQREAAEWGGLLVRETK